MKNSYIRFLILLLLITISSPLRSNAEILRFPPIDFNPLFTEKPQLLPGILGWLDFHNYITENKNFSHDSDMGIVFTLLSTKNLSLQTLTREIIQNQIYYGQTSSLGFYLRALLSDLRAIATLNLYPIYLSIGFRHDCKHDIDNFLGRDVVHDTIFLVLSSARITIPWRNSQLFSTLKADLFGEINLPYIFQEVKPEPDKSRLSLLAELIPLGSKTFGSIFTRGKISIIRRRTTGTEVYPIIDPAIDWLLQAGYKSPGRNRGITLYYQLEYITDPWIDNHPRPIFLQSLGVLLAVSK